MSFRWWPFNPDPRIASTRIRCTRLIDGLRAMGVDAGLYQPAEPPPAVLVLSKRYDRRTLQVAQELQAAGTRVVLDLCDNHFFADEPNPAALLRAALLRDAVAAVDAVTASTQMIAGVVRREVPAVKQVFVVGDAYEEPFGPAVGWSRQRMAAELHLLRLRWRITRPAQHHTSHLLWFGQHGTAHAAGGMLDLLSVMGHLNTAAEKQPITLTVISNHEAKFGQVQRAAAFPSYYLPWDQTTFSRAARLHHVALLPVQINPFTVCKTNNRVATSLLHGLAVIADPIPSYQDFAGAVMLGDWGSSLADLCQQPQLRRDSVERGLQILQAHWTLPAVARAWMQVLNQVSTVVGR